jgi:hypothetical protein
MKWALVFMLAVAGCTIRPAIVRPRLPSYDGTNLTSGVKIQPIKGGSILISKTARDRYNALVRLYGTRFLVPLNEDAGLTPSATAEGEWWMTPEAFEHWATMAHWRRSPKKPPQ